MVKFVEREFQVMNDEDVAIGEIRWSLEREEFIFQQYPGEVAPTDMQRIAERVNKLNCK